MIEFREGGDIPDHHLLELYSSVGWRAYTCAKRRDSLSRAIDNSTYVVTAWEGDMLVGLARGLSDDVSIFYLQDILVHPQYQRTGIGRRLLENCLEKFQHVRSKVLLTDDEEHQLHFYESLGFKSIRKLSNICLNAFVQIDGVDLT